MKILNLLAECGTGGIEVLCKNIIFNTEEDYRVCCLFGKGNIYEVLKKSNAKIFATDDLNKNIFKIVDKIEKYCIDEKIDIVIDHHGGINCNLIFLLLKKRLKNVKFVRYMHACFDEYSFGNDGNIIKRMLVKNIMNKAINESDLIIYISEAVKNSFESQFKIKNKRSVVIYNRNS